MGRFIPVHIKASLTPKDDEYSPDTMIDHSGWTLTYFNVDHILSFHPGDGDNTPATVTLTHPDHMGSIMFIVEESYDKLIRLITEPGVPVIE